VVMQQEGWGGGDQREAPHHHHQHQRRHQHHQYRRTCPSPLPPTQRLSQQEGFSKASDYPHPHQPSNAFQDTQAITDTAEYAAAVKDEGQVSRFLACPFCN
jgi:hypothetical protein